MAIDKAKLVAMAGDASKRCREVGPVPEWGDTAYIRRLSGNDRDAWDLFQVGSAYTEEDEKAGRGKEGRLRSSTRGIRAFLVCLGLCDENGERMFQDNEASFVGLFDGEAVDYLYDQIREYNGLGVKSQEELSKNSEPGPSDDSGSDLPANSE